MKRSVFCTAVVVAGLAGCGGDPDSSVKLVPVKGVVTINGKPMANALVAFVPEPGNAAQTAGGDTTGPEGNYLARYRNRSGLAPGKYKVTITPGAEAASPGGSEAFKDDPFMSGEGAKSAPRSAAKAVEIKGDFNAEVEPSGSTLDFDVKARASATGAAAKK